MVTGVIAGLTAWGEAGAGADAGGPCPPDGVPVARPVQ